MLEELQAARECYQEADRLFALLMERVELYEIIELADGTKWQIVDNFLNEGQPVAKVFRTCGVARFELKEIRPVRAKPKAAKKA